jgi:hypothetical protein
MLQTEPVMEGRTHQAFIQNNRDVPPRLNREWPGRQCVRRETNKTNKQTFKVWQPHRATRSKRPNTPTIATVPLYCCEKPGS